MKKFKNSPIRLLVRRRRSGLWQDNVALNSFDAVPDLEELADAQGVSPIDNFDDLLGDFWPENESVDDFLEARERWRREGQVSHD